MREVNERVATQLSDATFGAFDRIIDLCVEHRADFLLISGDVYDGQDRSLPAQLHFRDGLRRLSDHGIAAFVVHGNHDPLDGWAATLRWPESAHVFGGSSVERIPIVKGGETLAYIYGTSYPTQETRQHLARGFRRHTGDAFAIGILHCNVGTNTGHEPYAPCNLDDLIEAAMDYWALGHVHNHAVLRPGSPTVVYAGNPQGRNPRELGPRGCYLVQVSGDGHVTPRFVPTDVVRWFWESLSIEKIEDEEALLAQLETLCDTIGEQADGRHAVCRVTIRGRGPMHNSLIRPGFVNDLAQRLRDDWGQRVPFVWVERVDLETSRVIDVEARRTGQDFVGDLLRLFNEYRNDADRREALRQEIRTLYSSPRGRRFLQPPTPEELLTCLDAAETQCLDLLIGDDE